MNCNKKLRLGKYVCQNVWGILLFFVFGNKEMFYIFS